jgi:NAD(P)-dependent dehydrogenase (short-subunit alcohol dehydrogenase family)
MDDNRRSVLITGCSSGIGHDAAHALKARGWRVFATCRQQADCDRLNADGLESFRIDYEDADSIAAGFAEAMERTGGRLDALFNNGAYALPGALEDVSDAALKAIFQANFFGWHDLTRRAIRVMRAQGHGRILMNSSVLGFAGVRIRGAYVATKFAVEGYSDTLRLELRDAGIRVILLEPGPIRTRFRINARSQYERWIDRENSAFAELYRDVVDKRLYADSNKPDPFELGPEATSRKIVRALESRRPRPRYYVTTPTYIVGMLRRLLPTELLDRVLMRG